ncbi:MAG: SIS domain-containing protein [Gammaproteobacteria bacterium]|jgi:D-sedoheptulose 7-phosphate isomerase|nr:SIS domain-containing protein [Gammaproteobacteria bacterium]MBP6051699.1 SIS domain-containing protein [Pseudomonadales bacterium]MBK6584708.1 SIS domain-containing protein [Gammaproteobacteria bacterium]MBK7171041.1 SIS domain-containing protein [Gammaproteobacteria bacterium]MBK7519783.1 SIS domain-containing protein [Gammaproteobacteria bacterium]
MDEFEEPLQTIFADHVDTVYRSLDTLQPLLHRAVSVLCETMLSEHKLLVCGQGMSATVAQAFCTGLLSRQQMERPGLPVLAIGNDCAIVGAIEEGFGAGEIYSRQIHALAQPGDTLLVVNGLHSGIAIVQAVRAAQARKTRVIALTANGRDDVALLLEPEDLELRIPSDDPARIVECQLLLLNSLCALIERQLFGAP